MFFLCSPETIAGQVNFESFTALYDMVKNRLDMPILIDEIQILLGPSYSGTCVSCNILDSNNKLGAICREETPNIPDKLPHHDLRNPLSILVYTVVNILNQLVILSGTNLNSQEVDRIVSSAFLKNVKKQARYLYHFGNFFDKNRMKSTIEHYLPNQFSPDELEELYLTLRGRCRTTISFITLYLETGDKQTALQAISHYAFQFFSQNLKVAEVFTQDIKDAVWNYFMGAKTDMCTLSSNSEYFHKLLELGIVKVEPCEHENYKARLCEPVVLNALFQVFHDDFKKKFYISCLNEDGPKARGRNFEKMVAYDIFTQLSSNDSTIPCSFWENLQLFRSKSSIGAPIFYKSHSISRSLVHFLLFRLEPKPTIAIFQPSENAAEPDLAVVTTNRQNQIVVYIIQIKWRKDYSKKFFDTCYLDKVCQSLLTKASENFKPILKEKIDQLKQRIKRQEIHVKGVLLSAGCKVNQEDQNSNPQIDVFDINNLDRILTPTLVQIIQDSNAAGKVIDTEFADLVFYEEKDMFNEAFCEE